MGIVVASVVSVLLNTLSSISGDITGDQTQAMANLALYNREDIVDRGPLIFFYDYTGLKESLDIRKVRNSFFLTLPVRDESSNALSATAFTQTLGRSNRFGAVPVDTDEKKMMYVQIFGGHWELTRCCTLFQNLRDYQDAFQR